MRRKSLWPRGNSDAIASSSSDGDFKNLIFFLTSVHHCSFPIIPHSNPRRPSCPSRVPGCTPSPSWSRPAARSASPSAESSCWPRRFRLQRVIQEDWGEVRRWWCMMGVSSAARVLTQQKTSTYWRGLPDCFTPWNHFQNIIENVENPYCRRLKGNNQVLLLIWFNAKHFTLRETQDQRKQYPLSYFYAVSFCWWSKHRHVMGLWHT